jgi:hypothetical protein
MRFAFLLAFLLLAACASSPMPRTSHAETSSNDARGCFDHLLALGGYGRFSAERAAFLVKTSDGRVDCVVWPATNAFQNAGWSGPRPEGTTAIAHTHPRALVQPSAHDHLEATRLGLPIYVVTPDRVTVADPENRTE